LLAPARSQPGFDVLGPMAILIAVALLCAAGVWRLFERRNYALRGWLLRRLSGGRASVQ
jgi:hypothetical protein